MCIVMHMCLQWTEFVRLNDLLKVRFKKYIIIGKKCKKSIITHAKLSGTTERLRNVALIIIKLVT